MATKNRQTLELSWEVLDAGSLTARGDQWDRLVTKAGYPAFLQSRYLVHALRHFECERGCLVLGSAGERLLAGGLLTSLQHGQWSTYQPSQLPLGAWVMSPDCSWRDALPPLLAALPGLAVSVGLTQQDPRLVLRPPAETDCEVLDYVGTGWIDVVGTFEEYWHARGKNLRQNLRKLRRRLEEQSENVSFEFLDQPDEVDAAFREFAALESVGWKADEGTAISTGNRQGVFYREMLRDYAMRGAGFAARLAVGGRAIAVDFGVRDAETLVVLKTTYDEAFKAYSPAQLLHEQTFEHIFQGATARRIEFYGKLMEWHTRWTEQSCMLFHVNFYRSPLFRRARDFAKWARRQARRASAGLAGG